jgi:hypothetical protein
MGCTSVFTLTLMDAGDNWVSLQGKADILFENSNLDNNI